MYRHSLLLAIGITAFVMSPLGVAGTRTESARGAAVTLKKVTSSLDPGTGLLTIEASAPVPYVASQLDARTTVVEMRGVVAGKSADSIKIDQRHPVGTVNVESALAADGAPLTRVRITFRQPNRPRIRSSRNVILVEADRADRYGDRTEAWCRDLLSNDQRRSDHAAGDSDRGDPLRDGAARCLEYPGAEGRPAPYRSLSS